MALHCKHFDVIHDSANIKFLLKEISNMLTSRNIFFPTIFFPVRETEERDGAGGEVGWSCVNKESEMCAPQHEFHLVV